MSERINVLGIEINNYTAKEAMQRVMNYIKHDSLQVIVRLTLGNAKKIAELPVYKETLEKFEIVFPDSRFLMEAAGVQDKQLLKEAEEQTFMKLFVRYLHKNQKRVFLLAETQALCAEMQEFIKSKFPKIVVVGVATFEEYGNSEEMIVNSINGVEADCVAAALSSPMQEIFISKYRMALNAKLWLGLGTEFGKQNSKGLARKIRDFLERRVLKKQLKNVKKI